MPAPRKDQSYRKKDLFVKELYGWTHLTRKLDLEPNWEEDKLTGVYRLREVAERNADYDKVKRPARIKITIEEIPTW
jgi:hypothetical protein